MTHHAHSETELTEYEQAEKDYEALVRELELVKYDVHVDDATKAALAQRIDAARARFEELSHSVTGVVGPPTSPTNPNAGVYASQAPKPGETDAT
jgi:hypothetical protein